MALLKRKPSPLSMVGSEIVFCNGSANTQARVWSNSGRGIWLAWAALIILYFTQFTLRGQHHFIGLYRKAVVVGLKFVGHLEAIFFI